jgi:hypothetical protein
MNLKSRTVLTAGCAVAIGVLCAEPASAAVDLLSVGPGKIVAKGVGLSVPLTFVCDEGGSFFLQAFVTQRSSNSTVSAGQGSGSDGANACTGSPQTYTLNMIAQGGTFKSGRAVAEAFIDSCNVDGVCSREGFFGEILLKK